MRYYFDIFDGSIWVRDDLGLECRDARGARYQAVLALTEMAREQLPQNGDEAQFRIRVRNGAGPRFTVRLDFQLQGEAAD